MTSPATITQLLIRWRNGDKAALDELAPLVYSELRRLARYYLRAERHGHTLQPSDLVHEAYLRLVDEKDIDWQNRAHFFGVAAVRMRHILVERARSRRAAKRGGGEYRLTLSEADRLTYKSDVNLLELEKEARAAHLAKVCGDDGQLREEAERLIAAHEREGSFIDSPIFAEPEGLTDNDCNEY